VNNPKFSVIIPTYNRANQIKDAIKSVLDQTLQSFEIIVIDNFSTDNTVSLIKSFKDKRIKFFSVKNKGNIAYSRNFGIKKSIGKYIAFLDSDDSWAKNKLEECIQYLDNGSDLTYHNLVIKNNRKNFFLFKKKYLSRKLDKYDIYNDLILNGPAFPTSSVVVNKNIFKKIKYFNENKNLVTWEDFDAWIRLSSLTNNFYRIDKDLGYLGQGEIIY
jgi:glycosyltransferase involved in cell wall biosynthesis